MPPWLAWVGGFKLWSAKLSEPVQQFKFCSREIKKKKPGLKLGSVSKIFLDILECCDILSA